MAKAAPVFIWRIALPIGAAEAIGSSWPGKPGAESGASRPALGAARTAMRDSDGFVLGKTHPQILAGSDPLGQAKSAS